MSRRRSRSTKSQGQQRRALARRHLSGITKDDLWAWLPPALVVGGGVLVLKMLDYANPIELAKVAMGFKILNRGRADGVLPQIQALLDDWEREGPFPVMVGRDGGIRTAEEQLRLYAQGRTAPGPIVTKLKDGPHNHRAAIDLWPVINGKIRLDDSAETWALYVQIGAFGKARGFNWGGDWDSPKDGPHLELPNWKQYPNVTTGPALV